MIKAPALLALLFALSLPLAAQAGTGDETNAAVEDEEDYLDFGEDDDGVTVVATPETTQQMQVIDKETIEKRNASDLAALLEEELNMSVTRFGAYGSQTDLNMRGFDTERIAILIDGVPANSPRSGEFDVSQINLNDVERIEVIYGGSDTRYNVSGALGGVINIITVKKQKPGLHIGGVFSNTGYLPGPYNRRRAGGKTGEPEFIDLLDTQSLSLFAGGGAEMFSWKTSLFGNRAGNHYLYRDDYGFARRKISSEVLDFGTGASLVWNLPRDWTFLADAKLYYADKNFPVTMNSTGSARAADLQITENLMLTAPVFFRDDLGTEASLTYRYSQTAYGVNSSGYDHYLTAVNRWGWYPSEKFTLRSGLDWRFLYVNAGSGTETRPVKTGNLGGLHFTGEWTPVRPLMLVTSLKGVTDTRQATLVPKLGLSWKARPAITLKNNYFRVFKFPDFDDLYYRSMDSLFVGNPNLRPEDGWGTDIIGEFTLNREKTSFSAQAALYGQWTEDSIHWVKSRGGRWSPENVGRAWFAGFDARPALTFAVNRGGVDSVKLALNYQYLMTWLVNGDLGIEDSYRIPYTPTHIIGGTLDFRWTTGSLLLSAQYETTRYADTLNELVLDPYCITHLTLNQNVGKSLTVFGSLRNILNAHYESFAGYYMPGLSFILGLRSTFHFDAKAAAAP